ncbi:SpoIIE family protein phosphatase [Modestobacter italicus]|nr:SpoIIE family protein phosphatase [Modestobacter marinus]
MDDSMADDADAVSLEGAGDVLSSPAISSLVTSVVGAMPAGFVSMDRDWRFSYLNAAAERLLGHSRKQLIGRTIWTAFPDVVGNDFEAGYRRAVDTGEPQTLEAYYPEPLNSWYEVLCWPTAEGLSLYFSDVTDRKLAAEQAARATARLRLLSGANNDLLSAPDVPAAVAGLARVLVPVLADGCMITLLQPDGRPEDVGHWHADPQQRDALNRYVKKRLRTMPLGSPVARVLAGAGEVLSTTTEVSALLPAGTTRTVLQELDASHAIILPIRGKDRVLGALSLFTAAGRPLDPDDITTARDMAARAGLALDADRVSRQYAQLAEELQRSLLTAPPEPDHAHIVVRYIPATESARVGGDWYDAFMQPSGATMLVIGDVAGHDVQAAAAMGQLHGLLRGIATATDAGPAQVLTGLDQAMELLQVQPMATAVIARLEQTAEEFDRGVTRLVWANAGHPALLVIHADGHLDFLRGGRAELLLGVNPTAVRTEQTIELDRGATVLLYTDGLVERRSSDLDQGQQRLQDAVAELIDLPLEELCDELVARMVDGHPDDDVALVAARLYRQDEPRPAVAGPNKIPPPLRRPGHS